MNTIVYVPSNVFFSSQNALKSSVAGVPHWSPLGELTLLYGQLAQHRMLIDATVKYREIMPIVDVSHPI